MIDSLKQLIQIKTSLPLYLEYLELLFCQSGSRVLTGHQLFGGCHLFTQPHSYPLQHRKERQIWKIKDKWAVTSAFWFEIISSTEGIGGTEKDQAFVLFPPEGLCITTSYDQCLVLDWVLALDPLSDYTSNVIGLMVLFGRYTNVIWRKMVLFWCSE